MYLSCRESFKFKGAATDIADFAANKNNPNY